MFIDTFPFIQLRGFQREARNTRQETLRFDKMTVCCSNARVSDVTSRFFPMGTGSARVAD